MVDFPDWYAGITPSRTVLRTGQARYVAHYAATVPSGGYCTVTLGPTAGWMINIGSISLNCTHSFLVPFTIEFYDGTVWGYAYRGTFDVEKFMPYPELASDVLFEGYQYRVTIWNTEAFSVTFGITVQGTLEQV